jgi:hypothetical protein
MWRPRFSNSLTSTTSPSRHTSEPPQAYQG